MELFSSLASSPTHLISGSCMSRRVFNGTPRKQSAMSSSSLVEQPICSPIFILRSFGSCTEAQGLRAEPLDNTTRWNNPAQRNRRLAFTGLAGSLCSAKLTWRMHRNTAGYHRFPVDRAEATSSRQELCSERTVIILAWIIRGRDVNMIAPGDSFPARY